MKLQLNVNNTPRSFEIEPGEMLLEVLRQNGFLSVKNGCSTGSCGICTVLLDGKPIPSCAFFAAKAEGHNITTIEGVFEEAEKLGKLITAEGAEQCGYCSPGFVLTVIAMKKELKTPDDEEIKDYLVGNLCRCSGYLGHLRAVKKYLEVE